jgi:hypothetical protein
LIHEEEYLNPLAMNPVDDDTQEVIHVRSDQLKDQRQIEALENAYCEKFGAGYPIAFAAC